MVTDYIKATGKKANDTYHFLQSNLMLAIHTDLN